MSANQTKKSKKGKGKGKGKGRRIPQYRRKRGRRTSTQNQALLTLLKPSEQDVMKMLAAQTHIGRRRSHVNMKRYIWKRRPDGIHVINLEKTWAKLMLAARILVTITDPADICVMSTRTYGQRGAIKFAHYTRATPMVGKWVPGTFTNPQNKAFFEPRIVIVDDPSTCFAALRETSYVGIPVIALCGTDNNSRFVDCAIPCNNRGKFSIGLMFWLLARELKRMKGEISRNMEWKESVDLFFYRDADEIKRQQDAKAAKLQRAKNAQQQRQYQQDIEQDQQDQDIPYDDQNYIDGNVDDQQQYVDDGNQQQQSDQPQDQQQQQQFQQQDNWDIVQQDVEDWGADDNNNQQQQQQQQQPPPQQPQPPQQQQQQFDQQQDDGGAMGMQNW